MKSCPLAAKAFTCLCQTQPLMNADQNADSENQIQRLKKDGPNM